MHRIPRFAKWRDGGTLEKIFHALSADADLENLSMDSTCIKVRESASGGGKTADKAVGCTRGGLNTKLHAIVDGLGNTVTFLLSAGNDHDLFFADALQKEMLFINPRIVDKNLYNEERKAIIS